MILVLSVTLICQRPPFFRPSPYINLTHHDTITMIILFKAHKCQLQALNGSIVIFCWNKCHSLVLWWATLHCSRFQHASLSHPKNSVQWKCDQIRCYYCRSLWCHLVLLKWLNKFYICNLHQPTIQIYITRCHGNGWASIYPNLHSDIIDGTRNIYTSHLTISPSPDHTSIDQCVSCTKQNLILLFVRHWTMILFLYLSICTLVPWS